MPTWLIIAIGFAVLLLAFRRYSNYKRGIPVLGAEISTNDGIIFNVSYSNLHPEIKEIEYVHLVLQLLSKFIYISDPKVDLNRKMLLGFLGNCELYNSLDEIIKREKLVEVVQNEARLNKLIVAKLYASSSITRTIVINIPLKYFPDQFYKSWLACFITAYDKLGMRNREILYNALCEMNIIYRNSHSSLTLQSMYQIPNESFFKVAVAKT